MGIFIEMLETYLTRIVQITTILMELFGICILVITGVRCFFMWIKDDDSIRLELAQGIALALEFKMGGEVLRTVIVREWTELGILGATIALRGILTFIIHWEIKNEKKEMAENTRCPGPPELPGKSGSPAHPEASKAQAAETIETQTADTKSENRLHEPNGNQTGVDRFKQ